MLLNASKSLDFSVEGTARHLVLDALRDEQFTPLILTARRRCFELSLGGDARGGLSAREVRELEAQLVARSQEEGSAPYPPGDLFCSNDCIFYLAFQEPAGRGVRAGVVYDSEAVEPLTRFERFCQRVREVIMAVTGAGMAAPSGVTAPPHWEAGGRPFPRGLARFIEQQDADLVRATRFFEGGRERTRAARFVAQEDVRALLRRVREAKLEGYSQRFLTARREEHGAAPVESLVDAGLLQREVRVTCRKTKHALFDLPSGDALALITVSRARCSQCSTPVADEVVEEVYNPTRLCLELLEDAAWLRNHVYQIVRTLGVPESEIALGPPTAHGEPSLVANVCGESFLFVMKDGELSPSFVRRLTEAAGETEARHVVVVATGTVEEEAQMRLYEYAWRRARDGNDVDVCLIEGSDDLRRRIEGEFERALSRTLARDLFALDRSLGMSATRFVMAAFKLRRESAAKRQNNRAGARAVRDERLAIVSPQAAIGWEPGLHLKTS